MKPGAGVAGHDQFPKRDRLTTSPLSSPRATPRPCFFTGSQNTKKVNGHSSRRTTVPAESFWSSRCTDQPRPTVFLNIDHDLGLTQLLGQPLVVALQLLVLFGEGIALGFRSALPRRESLTNAGRSFRRHFVKCDEYRPSRRNKAPMPPCSAAASAFVRICCLYSAVNLRRFAFATTSGSGRTTARLLRLRHPLDFVRSRFARPHSVQRTTKPKKSLRERDSACWVFLPP